MLLPQLGRILPTEGRDHRLGATEKLGHLSSVFSQEHRRALAVGWHRWGQGPRPSAPFRPRSGVPLGLEHLLPASHSRQGSALTSPHFHHRGLHTSCCLSHPLWQHEDILEGGSRGGKCWGERRNWIRSGVPEQNLLSSQ